MQRDAPGCCSSVLPAEPRQWLYPIRISCNHCSRCTEGTEQPLSQAQPADLQQRRQELTQISQHQRALIDQRLRCINQASKISDLERCNSHYQVSEPMHSGSWSCPMW